MKREPTHHALKNIWHCKLCSTNFRQKSVFFDVSLQKISSPELFVLMEYLSLQSLVLLLFYYVIVLS